MVGEELRARKVWSEFPFSTILWLVWWYGGMIDTILVKEAGLV